MFKISIIVLTFFSFYSYAQQPTIEVLSLVEKSYFYNLENVIDISYLENKPPGTGVLFEYHGPQSINCHQRLDSIAEKMLYDVRKKKNNLDYILVVDWEACKIISLEPYSTNKKNYKESYIKYHISLTSDRPKLETKGEKDKIETKIESNSNTKRFLVVTRQHHNGDWTAYGPYGPSFEVHKTEQSALGELYYDQNNTTFICTRKNYYKIYAIKDKMSGEIRFDVREFLKNLGITDVPN